MKSETQEIATTSADEVTTIALPGQTNLIEMALTKGAGIDTIERLVSLYEREQAKRAAKAFHTSLSAFQAEVGEIKHNKKGFNGTYSFADLSAIVKAIKEPMHKHGFTHRYEFRDLETKKDKFDLIDLIINVASHHDLQKEKAEVLEKKLREILSEKDIEVTCIITHRDGHSERTTMVGPEDFSGFKNAMQSRGSSTTYLERYCLIGALGLVTADSDNDGGKPKGNPDPLQPKKGKQGNQAPEDSRQKVDDARMKSLIEKILSDSTVTLETIEKHFILTDPQREELNKCITGKRGMSADKFKIACKEVLKRKVTLDELKGSYNLTEEQLKTLEMMQEQADKK